MDGAMKTLLENPFTNRLACYQSLGHYHVSIYLKIKKP